VNLSMNHGEQEQKQIEIVIEEAAGKRIRRLAVGIIHSDNR
jgi:hypothetical protein